MSKVILVMDKQERCDGCILHGSMIGKQICNAEIKRVKDENKKPPWCPLKEVRKTSIGIEVCVGNQTECVQSYVEGYNACIDEILKESDGT